MDRKTFLKTSLLAAGGVLTSTSSIRAASFNNIRGANDRLGIALVGSGRRCREVASAMMQTGRMEIKALCDIWDVQRQRAKDHLNLREVFETNALEDVLQQPGIDAVVVATPDHLHKDYAVKVLDAGLHLYLEKPATLHFEEGTAIRNAVSESGKVCQTGTQQRSGSLYKRAKEEFFDGSNKLGDIVFVRAKWSDFGWQRRQIDPQPKPDNFDWQGFLGPAPQRPYEWARYDGWRNYKEYGAGILSDLLTHWVDVAQWMMDDSDPLNAVTSGGIYFLNDGRTNPDTVNSIIQYKNWNFSFECSVMPVRNERQSVLFHGTKGKLEIFREGYIYSPHNGQPQFVENEKDLNVEHVTNFIDAIKHNQSPSANIEIGLQAVRPSHMAVAAYWSGKRTGINQQQDQLVEK